MRFVAPDVARIDLQDTVSWETVKGVDGQPDSQRQVVGKNWIEIKKELTVGEEKSFRTAGFRRVSTAGKDTKDKDGNADRDTNIEVDWKALSLARVNAYLLEWSATDAKTGKSIPVSFATISNLHPDDFDEIDQAIQDHIAKQVEEKKAKTG